MTMTTGLKSIVVAGVLLSATALPAQNQPAKPLNPFPLLRLDAEGPVSQITSLAFSPDGKTLYAAGYDKVVYVWMLDENGKFQINRQRSLRIPIGPGLNGVINAMAVSSDGRYLAVGGKAMGAHLSGFSKRGLVLRAATQSVEQRLDTGTIHVFDLEDRNQPKVIPLRGHIGTVIGLTFAPSEKGQDPVLVSAGEDYDESTGKQRGAVRVWNLNQPQTAIAEKLEGLIAPSEHKDANGKKLNRPRAIAAVRTGDAAKDVQVGIAWGDNELRVWDVKPSKTVSINNAFSVACAAADNKLLLAGGWRQGWHLGLWKPPAMTNAEPETLHNPFHENTAPVGLATAGDNTALVVYLQIKTFKTGFFLANAKTLERQSPDVEFGGGGRRPAFAISPTGNFVAVAGNVDHKIQVFSGGSLKQQNAKVAQVLESQGKVLPRVRFYRSGPSLGLGLNRNPKSRENKNSAPDVILDLSKGKTLSQANEQAGWKPAPNEAKFTATAGQKADRQTVEIKFADGKTSTIVLPKNQFCVRSEIALCKETANHPPLVGLIVQSRTFAESQLNIYNAKTGNRLRWFQGHTDRISSIAFSDDGKLLASAASDRTVRVWWLEDLNRLHIGKHGFLDGLELIDKQTGQDKKQTQPVIRDIDEFAAADIKEKLKVGDVVTGYWTKNEKGEENLTATKEAYTFFYYLSSVRPGKTVKLQIERDGAMRTAEVKVQQAIDERKPLFTLFFQEGNAAWSWIGWHPTGPFQSSDKQIETLVGWHFNSGNAAAPPAFADIGKYHKKNFGKGLFQQLIQSGKVPAVWPPIPQEPKMSLHIHEGSGENRKLLGLDSQQRAWAESEELKAVLNVSDYPESNIKNVTWMLDETPIPGKANGRKPGSFEADLSKFGWKPKLAFEPYKLRVELTIHDNSTHDLNVKEYPKFQEIVFHPGEGKPPVPPPGPTVVPRNQLPTPTILIPPEKSLTTLYEERDARETTIVVDLTPYDKAQSLAGKMTFQVNGNTVERDGKRLVKTFDGSKARVEVKAIPLQNGENWIRVRLESKDGREVTLSKSAFVNYRRPPQIKSIVAEAEESHPRAKITCRLTTPVGLGIEELTFYSNNNEVPIDDPNQITKEQDPNDPTLWKVTARGVVLNEGLNRIRVTARNKDGRALSPPTTELTLKAPPVVVALPDPPAVNFTNVNEQVSISSHIQGESFPVKFEVLAPGKLRRVFVYLNGIRQPSPALPAAQDNLKYSFNVPVKLQLPRNELRVIAMDENARLSESTVTLVPLEPPVQLIVDSVDVPAEQARMKAIVGNNLQVSFPQPAKSSTVVLNGRIKTDTPKKMAGVYLKCWVNGFLYRSQAAPVANNPREWKFRIPVVLTQQKNRVSLELPEMAESQFSQLRCQIDLAKESIPKPDQRLHLVVVGVDPKNPRRIDQKTLEQEAKKAFNIQDGSAPNFKEAATYVLPPGAGTGQVAELLDLLDESFEITTDDGEHEVVMFYYQGQEVLNRDEDIVLTTDDSALTDKALTERLNEMYGAHVVFLDVAQPQKIQKQWETGQFLGMLRAVHDGAMPAKNAFPLMNALRNALPKTQKLNELPNVVEQALPLQQQKPEVVGQVPEDLKGLIVGAKKP